MNKALLAAATALALALPLAAQETAAPSSSEAVGQPKTPAPAPSEIVAAAPAGDWVAIPAEELLVMTLAPDAEGKPRTVVIQLMPAPFSQGWVHNIRLFARAGWYDGISVNRVQDNYVTQWGDPNYDNPEATGKPKPLPEGLKVMGEAEYTVSDLPPGIQNVVTKIFNRIESHQPGESAPLNNFEPGLVSVADFPFSFAASFDKGFPFAWHLKQHFQSIASPIHCYGMVGVGRNYSPDTGSGAELYTVIGHAPRHLDRNIALVGRVIEGMQHLSSLPRGSGALGFYTAEEAAKRTPILSVRVGSDLPAAEQPKFEYLSTESATFARYAEAIANRRDPFFIVPAGGADVCNIRVPVRRVAG
ncbi:MAG: peptidylprolyl isomerase [Porphyrobacter sp.]|nr:peptidylprolyl isomerase [Porphyrobacter sp.]